MKITRRKFLKLGLMGTAALALPAGTLYGAGSRVGAADSIASPAVEPFKVPLPIPPVARPVRTDGNTDYYKIAQRASEVEILPGLKTEVWGYDGIFPGPTIEARSGRKVVIRQKNELPVPVATHLHGGKTPPESDGYPTDLILPESGNSSAHGGHASTEGSTRGFKDYEYPNEQRAATLWFHDHRMDFTGPQVYKGLAGFSPAERFDVVVDFSKYPVGTKVTLKNLEGEGRATDVMRFEVVREEKEESAVPERLAPEEDLPDPDEAEVTRRFDFIGSFVGGMSTINLEPFDPDRIDASPRLGSTEIWEFSANPEHPIHLHLVHFRVLSRDGGEPGPYDAGWKDTVFVRGGTVRVAARFDGWPGKYVFHCHNLEHEDMMMMSNFEVV